MDVKRLLGGIGQKKALVREYADRIKAEEAGLLPRGLRYDKTNTHTSAAGDRIESTLDSIDKLRKEQEELILQYTTEEKLALDIIKDIEDPREVRILTMRYLRSERNTFSAIADEMGYSERHIIRIYKSAIKSAQEVADKKMP